MKDRWEWTQDDALATLEPEISAYDEEDEDWEDEDWDDDLDDDEDDWEDDDEDDWEDDDEEDWDEWEDEDDDFESRRRHHDPDWD